MAKGEKLRLLLVTKDKEKSQPSLGSAPRNCCCIITIQLCGLFIFFTFLVIIALRIGDIQSILRHRKEKPSNDTSIGTIPGSDFCKSVNTENMSLIALGYLTGVREVKDAVEAKNKVYYLTDRWFTDQEACAIEALLRLLQDKLVFVVEIGNFSHLQHTNIDFIQFLMEQYTNLNLIKSTPDTLFKGSPFQKLIKTEDHFSVFAAKVLLVWQFGGTVLSPELLLLNRRLYDNNEGFCETDKNLLFCPNQCSAYMYQLIKTILDILKSPQPDNNDKRKDMIQNIIDDSVADYCGDKTAAAFGCIGVNRLKERKICFQINENCDFLKVQEWKSHDINWKKTIQKFCPKIAAKYVPTN